MKRSPANIAVLGSINMDLMLRCATLPSAGETVRADSVTEVCGGKGANQAVAAARAGGEVTLIGRVGDDAFSGRLLANLLREKINCQWVQTTDHCASGLAIVAVEQSGQNSIVIVPGANARLCVADVENARSAIEASDLLLVQLEIPLETALAGIAIARNANVRVILDPAPAPSTWPPEMLDVDLICPNEAEAATLLGESLCERERLVSAAEELQRRGAKNVAITLGQNGTLLRQGDESRHVDSYPITAVDTTAAGDAFAGALVVVWAEGWQLSDAVNFANAAGALAASRWGAQPGLPWRHEVERLYGTEP